MDIIADASETSKSGIGFSSHNQFRDDTMENASFDSNSWNTSDEYSVDGMGNRVQRQYMNDE